MSKETRITSGTPKGTFAMAGTDAAQNLTAAELVHAGNAERKPVSAMITVEDENLRYTVGDSTPSVAPLGHLTEPGDVIYLECYNSIKTFKFINAAAAVTTNIMVTVGF